MLPSPYSLLCFASRVFSKFVKPLYWIRLNRYWAFALKFLPRKNGFVRSVYGPYLAEYVGDHQFYLCATGKSGFKLASIIKSLDQDVVFFDVGANIGLYSLIAAKNPNISGVVAIEPNPIVTKYLHTNLAFNNAKSVQVFEGAVSERSGSVELNYHDWHLGMGSIERSGTNSVHVRSLNRKFLSDQFSSIGSDIFVKIDVEGAELEVIKELFAASNSSKIKYLFVEITPKWLTKNDEDKIYRLLGVNGFKLIWKSRGSEQYDAYFIKDNDFVQADLEKNELLSASVTRPKYTICIPNYNMGDTLDSAISSVAQQLSEDFEILVVDDGSSDDSREVIAQLQKRFPIVRAIFLDRNKDRLLGQTRNFSIYCALGDYVLLHIDADDVWDPYLKDLVHVFHRLETAYKRDFLLVGQQTGMAKRELMLLSGGYENIYRGEDRNLMFSLAEQDRVLFLDYKPFRRRLERPAKKKALKVIWDMWSHLEYDLVYGSPTLNYVFVALLFSFNNPDFTLKTRMVRMVLILPAFLRSLFLKKRYVAMGWDQFLDYRQSRRGNFEELMTNVGQATKLDEVVSGEALKIFSHKVSNKGFKSE